MKWTDSIGSAKKYANTSEEKTFAGLMGLIPCVCKALNIDDPGDDMKQIGAIGLLAGIRTWNPSRGSLSNWVWMSIRGAYSNEFKARNRQKRREPATRKSLYGPSGQENFCCDWDDCLLVDARIDAETMMGRISYRDKKAVRLYLELGTPGAAKVLRVTKQAVERKLKRAIERCRVVWGEE
jgi:RNA polymerase sigma factor (sigma-70 family)